MGRSDVKVAPKQGHRYLALSGTPGTGKTATAACLPGRFRTIEVADLAIAWGLGRRDRGAVRVDLGALTRRWARQPPPDRTTFVVGHLAHLLPIPEVILLRCHPVELHRRLVEADRGTPSDRIQNAGSEAVDFILIEAQRLGRTVFELDTSGRTPRSVGREIARLAPHPLPVRVGSVDWLADPRVTDFLLRNAR
ncbi:MAG TPA: hypothetical protein VGX00_07650 [Thermoplasmata archaeon]|nr:hypothetical protein [Thermoplasmata archaeon]